MKRDEELKTPEGQTAWHYYQLWMRAQRRMPPPAASFLTSKYYRTFINFTKFVKSVELPRPEKFIQLMVTKTYQPTLWTNDEVYTMYMEHLDKRVPPLEQVKMSLETLIKVADSKEIDICDVFDHLKPNELIHMIRVRKLSPWLLLFSKKFKRIFREETTPEQKIILETLIRGDYWGDQMDQYPDEIVKIKEWISEADL